MEVSVSNDDDNKIDIISKLMKAKKYIPDTWLSNLNTFKKQGCMDIYVRTYQASNTNITNHIISEEIEHKETKKNSILISTVDSKNRNIIKQKNTCVVYMEATYISIENQKEVIRARG